MDWVRELPWQVFWFGWGMVAMLAGGSLYAVWWARRNTAAMGSQPPVDVSALSPGYRMAWGKTMGPDLAAPLTGRPCVWWKVQVWESVKENRPGGISEGAQWVWREIVAEDSDRPVIFGDGAAAAAVWTGGATAIIPSGWSDWRGQSLPPENRKPKFQSGGAPGQGIRNDSQGTFGPRFRYVEQIIKPDAPIFALGAVTRTDPSLYGDDPPEGDGDADMGETSADGDGDSDGGGGDGGWRPEPNRLGLVPTRDSVIAADMAPAQWTIGKAKGRPFLISTEHPEAVSAEQELGAKGGMIMGGIFVALGLFLAWTRLAG